MSKEKKVSQKDTLGKILRYIRKYWFFVVLSLVLAALTVACTLYIPILTGDAVDLIIDKGLVDMPAIFTIMKRTAVVMIVTAIAQWVMNTCNNYITYHVIKDIRQDAFAKLEILPLKYIDRQSYGDVVSRIIADVDTFADGLLMGFTQLFTGVITIGGTLLFMLMTNVPITLVVVCITPVSFLVAKFIAKSTYNMFKLQTETRGEQTALIEEMIGNQYESTYNEIKSSHKQLPDSEDFLLRNQEVTTLMDIDQADDEVTVLQEYSQFN